MDPLKAAKKAVADYTEDPDVMMNAMAWVDRARDGVVAVRFNDMDFLVHNCDGTPDPMRDVEEVEFTSWPPTQGGRGAGTRMQVRGMF